MDFNPGDNMPPMDDFELFSLQAGRRKLSSCLEFGGSLPCFATGSPSAGLLSSPPTTPRGHHIVPRGKVKEKAVGKEDAKRRPSHYIRRTYSDRCGNFSPVDQFTQEKAVRGRRNDGLDKAGGGGADDATRGGGFQKGSPTLCGGSGRVPPARRYIPRQGPKGRLTKPPSSTTDKSHAKLYAVKPKQLVHSVSSPRLLQDTDRQCSCSSLGGTARDCCQPVRHFRTTSKGIVNCGDTMRSLSCTALQTIGVTVKTPVSPKTLVHAISCEDGGLHGPPLKVSVLGAPNTGKTTLARQFLTSETLWDTDWGTDVGSAIQVHLDGEEVLINIQESCVTEEVVDIPEADAFVVMYSASDRDSFHGALDTLYQLRHRERRDHVVVLLANKIDLVRLRTVADVEGKAAAAAYDCKYFESSALMNFRVAELLAGLVKQVHMYREPEKSVEKQPCSRWILKKVLGRPVRRVSKSCDDLLAP